MSRAICLAVVVALLAGCAQRQAATPNPEPEQAVLPSVTDSDPVPLIEAAPPVEGTGSEAETTGDAPTERPAATESAQQPAEPQPQGEPSEEQDRQPSSDPVVLLSVGDRTGDHGPEGPAWADLTALELVEIGNDLRVTLQFAGALPSVPAEGEVPLIGVDVGEGDSGYQLFVEGGGQSWEAYLQTPQGFVQYPGTFQLGGRSIVLRVPFNAVGSPTRAPVRAFVEWSQERLLLNATSEDRLDGQPHQFDRAP